MYTHGIQKIIEEILAIGKAGGKVNQILCSTGCLIGRPNGRNYHLIEEYSRDLQCDGLEFMMYEDWYQEVDELLAYLQNLHKKIPVMHCQKSIGALFSQGNSSDWAKGLERFKVNCHVAKEIGAGKLVMHLWDGRSSDIFFENHLRAYGEVLEIAKDYGLELLIENVVCVQEDPFTRFRQLAEAYPTVTFLFDTKMAAFHGQMELLYSDEFRWLIQEERIHHFHVNDYNGGYKDWEHLQTLPIGKGKIDFDAFFHFVKEINYQGDFTVEATAFRPDGTVDKEMLNDCFGKIRRLMDGKGR